MVKKRELSPLPIFDEELVVDEFRSRGIKPSHLPAFWRLLRSHSERSDNLSDLPRDESLPSAIYSWIEEKKYALYTSRVVEAKTSMDGTTTKLLVELQDKHLVEAVIMRHEKTEGSTHKGRVTLCVSSQVGCKMGCTFCATGTLGLMANLKAGEILEQLMYANRVAKVRNVVFMGMGEPLDNYDAVLSAIRAMVDQNRFGLAQERVTLSTVGVIPKLKLLTRDAPFVTLALSLHAPTQELRTQLVPTARNWKLDKLLEAVDDYSSRSKSKGGRVLMEYVMLRDVNDTVQNAHELGRLLQGRNVHVNLIPYNNTDVGIPYQRPLPESVVEFHRIVLHEYKIPVTVRKEMGRDIAGACGQLAINGGKGRCGGDGKESKGDDIEDLVSGVESKTGGERKAVKLTPLIGGGCCGDGGGGGEGGCCESKGEGTSACDSKQCDCYTSSSSSSTSSSSSSSSSAPSSSSTVSCTPATAPAKTVTPTATATKVAPIAPIAPIAPKAPVPYGGYAALFVALVLFVTLAYRVLSALQTDSGVSSL